MAKKKFSFFSTKPKSISEGYAQLAGAQIRSKGIYESPKTGSNKAKDDVLMDLGVKEKDQDYYARLPDRQKRSQKMVDDMRSKRNSSGKPKGETAAQREARLKREALEKEKAEGQERRKKFYKEKGERLAKLKAKLLNLA